MLDLLRVFQLVAQTSSFTQAARAAGLTRPAVSQQISQLERHFGVQLFHRTTRKVALTPAGEVLLEHARRVLAAAAEMESAMAALRREGSGTLEIGASTLPGECLLPLALARFRTACPSVEPRVRVADTDLVLGWVKEGQVDLGLIGRMVDDPDLAVEPFAQDEIVLVLGPDAAAPAPLTPADLRTLPLILREPGSATRATVEAALAQHGISVEDLRVVAELGSPEAVKAAVRSGMGAAFLSRTCLSAAEFPIVRVEGLDLRRPLCACWRRNRPLTAAAQALLRELTAVASSGLIP